MVTEKILAVMADLTSLPKTDRNEHQRFTFRGVDAVVNAVGPLLRKHGLIVYPVKVKAVHTEISTGQGKPMTQCVVRVTYRWHAATAKSEIGDRLDVFTVGEAFDAGDKATPKAMSVAYRTMMLQTLCLPTDEPDPDSHTYTRDPQPVVESKPKPSPMVKRMWALMREHKPKEDGEDADGYKQRVRDYMATVVGHTVTSSKDLTRTEVSEIIVDLEGAK
jgi:hypothetical protein